MEYRILQRDGESLRVCFRESREDDAPALVECIRDEYGSTYLKQNFYNPATLVRQQREGYCRFLVAEAAGEIAAVLGLKFPPPPETMCEWITGIVLKKYRRYGIMNRLFDMALREMLCRKGIASGYGFSVTYHDISQRSMGRLGFRPCGFLPSALLNMTHSFLQDANRKRPLVIIVRKMNQEDAGVLHIPARHEDIAKEIYRALGVHIETDTRPVPLLGSSVCREAQDAGQLDCTIWVDESGTDLAECIRDIESRYQEPLQTYNVFLNISDAKAVAAYELLCQMGYFFSGWRPICCGHEIMVLHKRGGLPIDFGSLVLTEEAARLRDYVKNCYEDGIGR
ncbi:MAG: GNAT family N-acetyltransferase [Selenomonadaceae bacterium]|nr:GNAT family N-acetyltransferase [Selenomonadaceae bacterium]